MSRGLKKNPFATTALPIFGAALLFLLSICPLLAQPLQAQNQNHLQFVVDRLTIPFIPKDSAIYLLRDSGNAEKYPAFLISLGQSTVNTEVHEYLVGTALKYWPKDSKILVLVKGENESFSSGPHIPEIIAGSAGLTGLKGQLSSGKERMKSWILQVQAQEESLTRLRADAEVVADLGKVVDLKEELDRLNSELARVQEGLEFMQKSIRLAKSRGNPSNFVVRESQLTKQLAELVASAKTAEEGEIKRRYLSEGEMQSKLALIEATRDEDIDSLQRELVRLRKQKLEITKGASQNQ